MIPDDIHYYKDIILGSIGGIVSYLFDFKRAKKDKVEFNFSISLLLINVILGAFMSYMVGTVLDTKTFGRDFIIGLSGFFAFAILVFAEAKFPEWIIDKVTVKKG